MQVEDQEIYYSSRKWLNREASPSTGSVVCCDGSHEGTDEVERFMFVEIADCKNKVRLHRSWGDSTQDFIDKLETLSAEIQRFIDHLKQEDFCE